MVLTDQWIHWWLSEGGMGIVETADEDPPVVRIIEGPRVPALPGHGPTGEVDVEVRWLLADVPMDYRPPANFDWEPMGNRTYDYEFSISDRATRAMLEHDEVVGMTTRWTCPHDDPDCDPADMDAGITFRVTDESFADRAPREIEGQPIRYSVVDSSG